MSSKFQMSFRGKIVCRNQNKLQRTRRSSSYFFSCSFRRRYLKTFSVPRSKSSVEGNERLSFLYYVRMHALWTIWLNPIYDSKMKQEWIQTIGSEIFFFPFLSFIHNTTRTQYSISFIFRILQKCPSQLSLTVLYRASFFRKNEF